MRPLAAIVACLAFAIVGLACGSKGSGADIPKADLQNATITLERTPCFGSCPAYRLTIHGDGSVVYTGLSNVTVEGVQIGRVSDDQVRQLAERFYDIDYFALAGQYQCPASDLPSAKTSIAIGGQSKAVDDYGPGMAVESQDCAAPDSLVQLENFIDEITNSQQWVGSKQ